MGTYQARPAGIGDAGDWPANPAPIMVKGQMGVGLARWKVGVGWKAQPLIRVRGADWGQGQPGVRAAGGWPAGPDHSSARAD